MGPSTWERRTRITTPELPQFLDFNHQHKSTKAEIPSFNLNRLQHNTLQALKNNDDIVILLADKNLEPVTMDKSTYIQRVIEDHLSDQSTYQQLQSKIAQQKLDKLHEQLIYLFQNPFAVIQNSLLTIKHKYFDRSFQSKHCTPTFYGLVKIHKNPWTL